tara:strand:- start:19 stop:207 length:189 start_codon:yes stop_codon:yes gene_type:complete
MIYSVIETDENTVIYGTTNRSCFGHDKEFQQWLRDNADNLPADIQAKVEAGELTIQDAEQCL